MIPVEKTDKVRAKGGFLAKYRCRTCNHEFNFDNTYGTDVRCPRCRSIGCKALTPTAMVFADSKIVATHEAKLDRYQARSLSMLSRLDQFRVMLLSYTEVLELSKKTRADIDALLTRAYQEAKDIRTKRLSEHKRDDA